MNLTKFLDSATNLETFVGDETLITSRGQQIYWKSKSTFWSPKAVTRD